MWKCGMNVRDCMLIKKLNEVAEATVETPIGTTKQIRLKDTVRQGTVYGPLICSASMDTINKVGYNIVTHYGPNLQIQALAYVDDVASGGNKSTSNNTIMKCNIMEENKKLTYNTDVGKSAIMIVNEKKGTRNTVTAKVKNGEFQLVEEYKYLGTWWEHGGKYKINIQKRKKKIPFMITSLKAIANDKNMGRLSTQARLELIETVIIPSLIYNAEAYTKIEINELEAIQGRIIRDILEIPRTTPYLALLLETGMLTMEAQLDYKKSMLYHNIINSDETRIIKIIIMEQRNFARKGTWYHGITLILKKYGVTDNPECVNKSKWKKTVKECIRRKTEESIKDKCKEQSKSRSVRNDSYEMKEYMKETTIKEMKEIVKTRVHMTNIPCNYKKGNDVQCWLCGKHDDIQTEHYFNCEKTEYLRSKWNTNEGDMTSKNTRNLIKASKFLNQVAMKNIIYEKAWKEA